MNKHSNKAFEVNKRVQLISQAQYAALRGVGRSAVTRAVKEGRISLIDGKVDPAVADIQWARNSRARADSRKTSSDPLARPSAGFEPLPGRWMGGGAIGGAEEADYSTARARRETAEAGMAEMRKAEMEGSLVDKSRVTSAVFTTFRQLRDTLGSLPRRVAAQAAANSDPREVELMLASALRESLDLFANRSMPDLMTLLGADQEHPQ